MSTGDLMYQYRQFLGCPLTHYQTRTFPPPNGLPTPNDGCQPFNTVQRILDLEKQVTQLRADIAALNKEQPNDQ